MKRFSLNLLIIFACSTAFSQKLYFVYLQAEPAQPFFIKVADKVHSSTASGYLILSRLKDSSFAISIGFPENKWPEQKFTIDMKSKDHGYSLKNFGEKGWGLYDMEAMTIQMAITANNNSGGKTETKDVSVFTDILSKAANDPSLKEKPVTVQEQKPVSSPPLVAREETKLSVDSASKQDQPAITKKEEPSAVSSKEEPVVKKQDEKIDTAEEYKRSVVTKKSENSTTDGLHLTFIDDYRNGKRDTIRIIIPNQKTHLADTKAPVREEKKFLDLPANDTVKKAEHDRKVAKTDSSVVSAASKKNCPSTATESDFLKIRKKMAAETNDEGMVSEAKKYFRTKCFSAVQVKNLSTLFLEDSGKYKFFDAAYEYVFDKENFAGLVSELKDEYYITRFKAMLR